MPYFILRKLMLQGIELINLCASNFIITEIVRYISN